MNKGFRRFFAQSVTLCLLNLSGNWSYAAKGDAFAVPDQGSARTVDVLRVDATNNQVKPGADNTYSLGTSALRWSDVQAVKVTVSGSQSFGVTAVVALSSTTSITPASSYVLIGSTGTALTLTSTPNISTSTAVTGQFLILKSTGPVITIQDSATLTSSGVSLRSGTTLTISSSTPRGFLYDGTFWVNLY